MCCFWPSCWVGYLTRPTRVVKGRLQNMIGKHSPIPWYIYRYIGGTHERNGGTFFIIVDHLKRPYHLFCVVTQKNKRVQTIFIIMGLLGCWLLDSFACDVHLLKPKSLMTVQHKSLPHTKKLKSGWWKYNTNLFKELKWKSWWWSTLLEISWATKRERVDDGLTLLTT